ncbi:hypothetical protein HMPREF1394_00069 [Helicobacter pylori GAM105Ai]|nr:hypothetical protein HMPREF1394_00069 [Helicobacter pylori GAM105Ai]EMH11795.1 hypothetical protein HMPREF1410_00137 [Helicobacter pylori GAM249T]EMH40309.1 hypothetical protein HMPREF1429_01411 [Helicobacter pylori GAM93Bi]
MGIGFKKDCCKITPISVIMGVNSKKELAMKTKNGESEYIIP